jgi:CHAD domain-containing protein
MPGTDAQRDHRDSGGTAREPRLRLVPTVPGPLGPVSPELVLVSPELAAAVRGAPTEVVVPAPRCAEPAAEPPPERPSEGGCSAELRYDTREQVLADHGLELTLRPSESGDWWTLRLPRGETVEAAGDQGGAAVPEPISSLIVRLAGDRRLLRQPRESRNRDVLRLQARLRDQRAAMLRHDPGTRLARDPENLHQLRVATRRARAFLRTGSRLVGRAWGAELSGALRAVGRGLGPCRDLDVLLAHLEEQAATLDERDRAAAVELLSGYRRERETLQRGLLETLAGEPYRRVLDELALPVEEASPPRGRSLDELAARELRRLVRDVRRIRGEPRDDELHALRIRVKRVRYAIELAGRRAGRGNPIVRAAIRLQDILGEHQDAVVAEERLREQGTRSESAEVAFVAGRLAERQRARREELRARLPSAWRELRRTARGRKD